MEAANSWSTPVALKLPTEFVYGANSREIRIQEDRERGSLSATYFSEHDIPYSPAEPDNLDQIPIDDSQIPVIPLSNPALNATLSNSAPVIPPATIVSSPADAVAALQNLTPLAIASLMDQMSGRSSSPKIGITAPNSAPPLAFANDPNFQEKLRALSQGSRLEANAHYPASQNGARQGWQANQPMQHGGYMASPYGQPQMQYGQQVPALTNMPYSQQQQAPPQKSQWQMLPTGGPGQYQNQRPPRQHEPNFRNNSNNNVRPVTKGHGIPKNRINKPCLYFFRDGKCIHGDNCRYSHTNPN